MALAASRFFSIALLSFFFLLCFSSVVSGQGQIPSLPCTSSMITAFTPCMNFVTNSTSNGTSPTQDCCDSIKSLMGNGAGCLCQMLTGSFPFQIPINRTLSIALPRACNSTGGVPICSAQAAAPAAGPVANGLPLLPIALAPPPAVEESPLPSPAPTTVSTTNPSSGTISGISGNRVGTSAASPTYSLWPLHIATALIGAIVTL